MGGRHGRCKCCFVSLTILPESVLSVDDPQRAKGAQESKTPFDEFLLAEYDNIAQAHFNTVDSLSSFIKHYIAIASIPRALAALFLDSDTPGAAGSVILPQGHTFLIAIFLSILSAIGLFVLAYVINIRFDAILYARTVNGIRKHFYDKSGIAIEEELRIRVLPRTPGLPNYIGGRYFGFVVVAFMLVGTSYFGAGWALHWNSASWPPGLLVVLVVLFAALHWLLYKMLGEHRERTYLQKPIIGVDIDGVLNAHRPQFSAHLKALTGKDLPADEITHIPVHEIPGTSVTESDEHAVFNWVSYWEDMPPIQDDVGRFVRKLRNILGFQVWIFTHRPWPEPSTFPANKECHYWCAWRKLSAWTGITKLLHPLDTWLENRGVRGIVRGRLVRLVTKKWLRVHEIVYDRLIVEGGNTNTADARTLVRNRYKLARAHEIRIFVEDTLPNALKLSNICHIVFLVDHPYNQDRTGTLPSNIVRVKSWADIYDWLKKNA